LTFNGTSYPGLWASSGERRSFFVLIAENRYSPCAFVPLYYSDEYEKDRGPFDAAFGSLTEQLAGFLVTAPRSGVYSYAHRPEWSYSFAGWSLNDLTLRLVQDEFDIQFGMDVTLWVQPAGAATEAPVWTKYSSQITSYAANMGTTFVTLTRDVSGNEPGFWMRDGMLELWLRLLALHLPEPDDNGEHQATLKIRNQWLLASKGYFVGCVPHGMEDACATEAGRNVVRSAIDSLLVALSRAPAALDANTLDLLGVEGIQFAPIERRWLQEIGLAFNDLLDGKMVCSPSSTEIMPGSKPYKRTKTNG